MVDSGPNGHATAKLQSRRRDQRLYLHAGGAALGAPLVSIGVPRCAL